MCSATSRFRLFFWVLFVGVALSAARASENAFRFIVLSDTHVGQNDSLYQSYYSRAVREIVESNPKPLAVFVTGDLTDHGRESEYDNVIEWFIEPLKAAGIPFYAIPGSRDIQENTLALWTNKIGALWQTVTLQQTRFILTCGVPLGMTGPFGFKEKPDLPFGLGQGGVLDSNQLAWIHHELEAPESRTAQILVMLNHHPLWSDDFGGYEIKDTDLLGHPTDAGKTLRDWMTVFGVDLFLCGNRHFQAPPIMHSFPNGRQTWHVLNESTMMGQSRKVRDAKGAFRTYNGLGYEVYDVAGTTLSHYRKALDSAGFALIGPANQFDITFTEPPPPEAPPALNEPAAPAEPAAPVTPATPPVDTAPAPLAPD